MLPLLTGLRITSGVLADRIVREGDRVRWMLAGLWSMLLQKVTWCNLRLGELALFEISSYCVVSMHSMSIGVLMCERERRSTDADLKGELSDPGAKPWGGGGSPKLVEARELRSGSRHTLRLDWHVSPLSSPPHPSESPLELLLPSDPQR